MGVVVGIGPVKWGEGRGGFVRVGYFCWGDKRRREEKKESKKEEGGVGGLRGLRVCKKKSIYDTLGTGNSHPTHPPSIYTGIYLPALLRSRSARMLKC